MPARAVLVLALVGAFDGNVRDSLQALRIVACGAGAREPLAAHVRIVSAKGSVNSLEAWFAREARCPGGGTAFRTVQVLADPDDAPESTDALVPYVEAVEKVLERTGDARAPGVASKSDRAKRWRGGRAAKESLRVLRLAALRNWLREEVRGQPSTAALDAVIVVDPDVEMPAPMRVSWAVDTVSAAAPHDLICANGRMGHHWMERYYDSFATVLENGTWPYPVLYAQDRAGAAASGRVRTVELSRRVWADVESATADVVPMRSCFGGFAVYSPSAYFEDACSYTAGWDGPALDAYQPARFHASMLLPCEHVVFNECLRGARAHFRAGVAPELKTWWNGS